MITVFTPTFNRAYIISNLYNSLCLQTCTDFEWLIVDDGSQDNTEELINSFVIDNKINIRFYKQENKGKHVAINYGVKLAKGELFFIVDSDDQLPPNSIKDILYHYNKIKEDKSFAGVSGMRHYFNGDRIGGNVSFSVIDCSFIEFRSNYRISGDLAEAYTTEILRKYPFPEIDGEKFCPESYVWYKIAPVYKLRFFNSNIYLCEYLPDGLTNKITQLRMNNSIASVLTYSQMYKVQIKIKRKIKFGINFWRFFFCIKRKDYQNILNKYNCIYPNILYMPIGYLYHLIDLIKIKK